MLNLSMYHNASHQSHSSQSLTGLRDLCHKTYSHHVESSSRSDHTLRDTAYRLYLENGMNAETGSIEPATLPGFGCVSRLSYEDLSEDFRHPLATANGQVEWKQPSQRGVFIRPTESMPEMRKSQLQLNRNICKQREHYAKFSLSSSSFRVPNSHISQRSVHRTLLEKASQHLSSNIGSGEYATKAKVFSALEFDKQRIDLATLFTRKIPQEHIGYLGSALSQELFEAGAMPGPLVPLGMEPVAPGVAYGEIHQPSGTKQSFGTSRARIVEQTINNANLLDENLGDLNVIERLNISLHDVLIGYGYEPDNPAFIRQ